MKILSNYRDQTQRCDSRLDLFESQLRASTSTGSNTQALLLGVRLYPHFVCHVLECISCRRTPERALVQARRRVRTFVSYCYYLVAQTIQVLHSTGSNSVARIVFRGRSFLDSCKCSMPSIFIRLVRFGLREDSAHNFLEQQFMPLSSSQDTKPKIPDKEVSSCLGCDLAFLNEA